MQESKHGKVTGNTWAITEKRLRLESAGSGNVGTDSETGVMRPAQGRKGRCVLAHSMEVQSTIVGKAR